MLDFQQINFNMKDTIDSYTFKYGENSCQHSFATSFLLSNKYGNMFCEQDNFLYTLRSKLCNENERVYLFPLGDFENLMGIKNALENIFEDAHSHNCRVKFETLTERAKNIVTNLYPGRFTVTGDRDLAEYIHSVEKLTILNGSEFQKQRHEISKFFRDYGDRCTIEKITSKHFDEILNFQKEWFSQKNSIDHDHKYIKSLTMENEFINNVMFENFEALGLCGIVLFIDNKIKGYEVGVPLSENCVDVIAMKVDRNIRRSSRALFHEFVKIYCKGYEYLNTEEDLGIEGLRYLKLLFKPEFLIEKFILTETTAK